MKQLKHLLTALVLLCSFTLLRAQCQAGFSFSVSGGTATFTNTSVGMTQPVYIWTFGDGGYSYSTNASHTYTNNGMYNVCLMAYDSMNGNCNSTFCDTIVITNSPCNGFTAVASATNASACNLCDGVATVSVSGGTPPYSYLWSNGATTSSVSNLCVGNYNVTVTDANGCTVQASTAVNCTPNCNASFTYSISGGTVTFTNTSTGGIQPIYYWNFGDNSPYATTTNATHTYSNGTYQACLTMMDSLGSCVDVQCVTITITNSPCSGLAVTAGATNASSCNACDGAATLSVTGGTAPYSYAWSNGNTTATISNLCVGNYTVTVTDANGCTASATAYVGCPNIGCQAGFSFTVNGGTVTFTNTSVASLPSYMWNFGDGNYAYTTNATHSYSNGIYYVCLTLADSFNFCSSTYCDTIVITNSNCNGFVASMTTFDETICNFCDGGAAVSASGGTPPYTYAWSNGSTQQSIGWLCQGTYYVTVTDANGCTATASGVVNCLQNTNCQAGFSYTVSGGAVTFTNTSTSNGQPYYMWDFGDGNYAYTVNASHTYANGVYVACLTLWDSLSNCSSTYCDSIVIMNSPCTGFSGTIITTDESVCGACDGTAAMSVSGGTAPYAYSWSTGGTQAAISGLCIGSYYVTATDANGCTVSDYGYVNCPPNPNCIASFTYTSNVNTVTFTNTSTGQSNPNMTYYWDFGDGNVYTGLTPPPHTYVFNGFYTACVYMYDSLSNCYNWYCDSILINNGGCFSYFYMYQDSVNTLLWYANPVINGTAPFTYLWDFGDGNQSTLATPQHAYATPGQYTICLTITDANGCTSTYCDSTSVQRILQSNPLSNQIQFLNVLPAGLPEVSASITKAWPNPASEYIDIALDKNVDATVRLIDMLGNVVYEGRLEGQSTRIGLENVAEGYYSLMIDDGSNRMHKKIAVIRQ